MVVYVANAFWILGNFLSDCTSEHFDDLATRLKSCTHMSLFSSSMERLLFASYFQLAFNVGLFEHWLWSKPHQFIHVPKPNQTLIIAEFD